MTHLIASNSQYYTLQIVGVTDKLHIQMEYLEESLELLTFSWQMPEILHNCSNPKVSCVNVNLTPILDTPIPMQQVTFQAVPQLPFEPVAVWFTRPQWCNQYKFAALVYHTKTLKVHLFAWIFCMHIVLCHAVYVEW